MRPEEIAVRVHEARAVLRSAELSLARANEADEIGIHTKALRHHDDALAGVTLARRLLAPVAPEPAADGRRYPKANPHSDDEDGA